MAREEAQLERRNIRAAAERVESDWIKVCCFGCVAMGVLLLVCCCCCAAAAVGTVCGCLLLWILCAKLDYSRQEEKRKAVTELRQEETAKLQVRTTTEA